MGKRSKSVEFDMPFDIRAGVLSAMLDESSVNIDEIQEDVRAKVKLSIVKESLKPMTSIEKNAFDDAFELVVDIFKSKNAVQLAAIITASQMPDFHRFMAKIGVLKSNSKKHVALAATAVLALLSEFRKHVMAGIPECALN